VRLDIFSGATIYTETFKVQTASRNTESLNLCKIKDLVDKI